MSGQGIKRPAPKSFGGPGFQKKQGKSEMSQPPQSLMDMECPPYMQYYGPGGSGQYDPYYDGGFEDYGYMDYGGGYAGPSYGQYEGDFYEGYPPMGPPPPMRGQMMGGNRNRFQEGVENFFGLGRLISGGPGRRFRKKGQGKFGQNKPINPEDMSISEKIGKLCSRARDSKPLLSEVNAIETFIKRSELKLTTDFKSELLLTARGRDIYTGTLSLSGTFLCRSYAFNRRDLRLKLYRESLEILKSKSAAEICGLKDDGSDATRNELVNNLNDTTLEGFDIVVNILIETSSSVSVDTLNGMKKLQKFLKEKCSNKNMPDNIGTCLERSVALSNCGLAKRYDPRALQLANGKIFFQCIFYLHHIPIAKGESLVKSDAREECCHEAVNAIFTKPAIALVNGLSIDLINDNEVVPISAFHKRRDLTLEEKLDEFIKFIQENSEMHFILFNAVAGKLGLKCTQVFKRVERLTTCDLYLDNILIVTTKATHLKHAQKIAYDKACNLLKVATSQKLLDEHKKLTPEDKKGSDVIEVREGWERQEDACYSFQFGADCDTEGWTHESFVIMEFDHWSKNRGRYAPSILYYSSQMQRISLEQNLEKGPGNMYKYTYSILNQKIGDGLASNKDEAKNLAAIDALIKLYETNTVVRLSLNTSKDSSVWISQKVIEEKMEKLKTEGGEVFKRLVKQNESDEAEESEKIEESEESNPEEKKRDKSVHFNPYYITVCKHIIDDFAAKETLEDLVFGPGMPYKDRREIAKYAKKIHHLKLDNRSSENKAFYMAFLKSYNPKKIVEILKGHTDQKVSAKCMYEIVPKSELPNSGDIATLLKKS